ncbi:hypothetical protein A3D11_03175 [Candidatus Peribacteria bacterium RIFCSPHIGHO2_02_FULL_49_16]|nr:MAG: hypothetical protein A3D11_03175 [Candidatus Peribacteria bacterium RIFCSPHIGHO2_02_FULL_49_16]
MFSYAAFLGHQPHISIAELHAVVPDLHMQRHLDSHWIIFESAMDIEQEVFRFWGGTIILAKQITTDDIVLEDIPLLLANELRSGKGKVIFGLRTENIARKNIKKLYRDCKEHLRSKGRSSRYVGNERAPAAPVLLHDQEMIGNKSGCELVLLNEENHLWIGRTVAAHDPDDYGYRDMEKPVRDTRTGLMPPKLAQIMLNLGWWLCGRTKSGPPTILDPFCGTGVIPMEALLRSWPVIASDLSLRAVNGCTKNMDWFRKEEGIPKKDVPSAVFKHDARKPFDFSKIRDTDLRDGPDIIVTETSLGPPLEMRAAQRDALKHRTENEKLQKEWLKNAMECLPDVPLVCTFPVWYLRTEPLFLEQIWKHLDNIGYKVIAPPGGQENLHGRPTLLYRRPNQFVGREIVMLRP